VSTDKLGGFLVLLAVPPSTAAFQTVWRQTRTEVLDNQLHTHYSSNAWVFMLELIEKRVGATTGWWRVIGKVKG